MNRNFLFPIILSSGFLTLQIIFGAVSTYEELLWGKSWLTSVHLGLSLIALAAITTIAVLAFRHGQYPADRDKVEGKSFPKNPGSQSKFAKLAFAALLSIFILLVSGSIVSNAYPAAACSDWPLCGGSVETWNLNIWINIGHRLIVLISGVLISLLNIEAWRKYKTNTTILTSATAAAVLFFAQSLLGAKMVEGFPFHLILIHQLAAVSVWITLVILNVTIGLGAQEDPFEIRNNLTFNFLLGRSKDFIKLTKPIVVILLLVTTFAGMVIASGKLPPVNLTIWTLLGGFLAAGGSSAINQYIDRYDDQKMQRTQKRPIPSGRITPAEGLAFGASAAIISIFIMTAHVNYLAGLLTLAGIIYYVLIYSIFLKKATVQNIVIGGGAGAIPPLIGWAAVTGSLNIPSLFLFAIIFVWTPPHFWALALVRKKDYARAGVPMLPVVRGEKETRWQILIYTIELVILTMLLPLFGLGGSIYLIGAALLGLWLISAAWRLWKNEGNKVAWKMYRYSSMYLAFLFFVLMVDRLL